MQVSRLLRRSLDQLRALTQGVSKESLTAGKKN
jgi:hypothetical protein